MCEVTQCRYFRESRPWSSTTIAIPSCCSPRPSSLSAWASSLPPPQRKRGRILRGAEVDVIVCDLGLPGENGLEFIRSVRALPTGHDVPAIAVTFFSERFGVREARAAGFDVYLRKPIDPTDIVHAVATLVNRGRPRER